jgi:hypothetical protein
VGEGNVLTFEEREEEEDFSCVNRIGTKIGRLE